MRRCGVVVAAIVLVGCTPELAPERESPNAEVIAALTEYLDGAVERREFRGAVQVRRGADVLLSAGFDQADVARDLPNRPDTRFGIASITKQFTAMAILLLQEDGELRVTDPACTHLPTCPETWRAITVEQLLTHTSGLVNYTDASDADAARFVAQFGETPTPDQLIQFVADRPLLFAPGARSEYNNTGYVLLGRIIEQRSGQTYGQFLHDRILGPLRMSGTSYEPDPEPTERDAIGYHDWNTPADVLAGSVFYAAGGIRSTVDDLARWQRFLLSGDPEVAEQDTIAQLLRPRTQPNSVESYGYGIATRGTGTDVTYYHSGGIPGFATYQEIHPATGLTIIVLSNLDTANATSIARNLASLSR